MDWRYRREPGYWRWRWSTIGSDARALLGVLAALAFGAVGYLAASGLSGDATAGSSLGETTVLQTITTERDGRTIERVVPTVRTVRVVSAESFFTTATEQLLRTVRTPAGTRVVTEAVTHAVPVLRRVVVTGPGGTTTRVATDSRTMTAERTVTAVETRTVTGTVTRTVPAAPVTETTTVTQPPVTETTTVTEPAVTVTAPTLP